MRYNETFGDEIAMTYDDVCLVPQYSTVRSRNDVDLSSKLLRLPFISSNMDSVTESQMAIEMHSQGGLGIIHRFMPFAKLKKEVNTFYEQVPDAYNNLAISVGVSGKSYEILDYCLE